MDIIELDGLGLSYLRDEIDRNGIYSLRIAIDGDVVKFKVNENMWSPPIHGATVIRPSLPAEYSLPSPEVADFITRHAKDA